MGNLTFNPVLCVVICCLGLLWAGSGVQVQAQEKNRDWVNFKRYAQANRIPYVNHYKEMVSGPERSLNPAYTKDGAHPTKEGYAVMEVLIKLAIDKAL